MERLMRLRDKILKRANGQKTVLVTRYGAIGDLIMLTPVIKQLKEDGYYVVMNTHENTIPLTCNPNIDAYIKQKTDEVPNEKLDGYWKELGVGFDKVLNFSGSIEDALLKAEGKPEFHLPKSIRHETCNKNYQDHTMELAGYDIKGKLPELYFSKEEHKWAKKLRDKYSDKFIVLVSMSGSAYHKIYPFMENVATEFLDKYKDTLVITVGDFISKILEWEHPRTLAWSGKLKLRKSLILTQYADLVVGTETGVLNAASCFDTPKIVMLSHSTEENLTKYWKNTESVNGNVSCYPCHQLHYSNKSCKQNSATDSPICMTMIRPEQILLRMETFYKNSRRNVA